MNAQFIRIHKIWYEGKYGLRVYAVRKGGYFWCIYPANLLFPEIEDMTECGYADCSTAAWSEGVAALIEWAEKPEREDK